MDSKSIMAIAVVGILIVAGAAFVVVNHKDEDNGGSTTPDDEYYPVSIKDAYGQEVTLNSKPQRIVSVTVGLDLMSWLNCGYLDNVVGTPEGVKTQTNSMYYAPSVYDFSKVATLPSTFYNAVEDVLNLTPDLVIILAGNDGVLPDVTKFTETMNKAGVQVFCISTDSSKFPTIEAFMETNLVPFAKMFNESSRATAIMNKFDEWINALDTRLSGITEENIKYVYVGGGSGKAGAVFLKSSWSTFYPTTYLEKYVHNIMKDISDKEVYELTYEDLYDYEKNVHEIDAVFVSSNTYKDYVNTWKEGSSRLTAISAVEDGEVYGIPQTMSRMCDSTVIDMYAIAQYLYPELFEGFDVDDFAKEVWSFLLGSDELGEKLYNSRLTYYTNSAGMTTIFEKIDPSKF